MKIWITVGGILLVGFISIIDLSASMMSSKCDQEAEKKEEKHDN